MEPGTFRRRPRPSRVKSVSAAPYYHITTSVQESGPSLMAASGAVTVPPSVPGHERLRRLCASGDFDVVLTQLRDVVDADLLATAQVKGASNFAVGFNNIDIAAATRHGILVGNTPGVLTDATADVAMALILATARRVVEGDRMVRDGRFTGWEPELLLGRDVSGAVLGLAGFGRIARATARRALGFGMEVLFTPRPPGDRPVGADELDEFAGRVRQVPWDELVARNDYLSLHVPLAEPTQHRVDRDVLRRMKPGAVLVNTACGPVVDEPRLAPGLAKLTKTVLLPHVASATVSVRRKMSRLSALNAIAMAEDRVPPHPVNPEAMRWPAPPPESLPIRFCRLRRRFDGGACSCSHGAVRPPNSAVRSPDTNVICITITVEDELQTPDRREA